jgi:methyl-accepting chemotaxis protein
MRLSTKLLAAFLAVGVIPFAVVSLISLVESSDALSESAYQQLVAVRDIKMAQIDKYFSERKGDINVLMETVGTLRQEAFNKLKAVQELKKAHLQDYFLKCQGDIKSLSRDKYLLAALRDFERGFLDGDKSTMSPIWESSKNQYGPWLGKYTKDKGYLDLFIVSANGDVVFSVEAQPDLGVNLVQGWLKDSGLAKAYEKSKQGVALVDFEPYAAGNDAQAAFLAAPISEGESVIGAVVLQLSTKPINQIMHESRGMGKTGESYLVGDVEGKTALRSNPRFMSKGKFAIGHAIERPFFAEAMKGKQGELVFKDPEENLVMAVFSKLEIKDLEWVMVSRILLEEAIAPRLAGAENDFYTRYIEQYGYYDLFLIAPGGEVFYTVSKEADYGTNMVNGKYASSGLGKLVRKVLATKDYAMADFSPYAPSKNEPASFIAKPFMENGKVEAIVALQLSLESINSIMQERSGMGKTGETYLVGPDKLMRSDSYLDPAKHSVKASFKNPDTGKADTEPVRLALEGETGKGIFKDYSGSNVVSAYAPVELGQLRWALLAEIDEAEAFAEVQLLKYELAIVGLVGVLAIVVVSLLIGRSITRPINQVVTGLNQGADQVASAAGQVSESSQTLAQGASEQAASLEETTASMEEMSSMTSRNAESAQKADSLMKQAKQAVEKAGNSMTDLKSAMDKINAASDEMAKIIKTIDEIAFQTNLLALNAAVEAARAGDAGAGFAVVAEEVRNLAIRAAEAAGNTTELIEGNLGNIKKGVELLGSTDQAFGQVAEGSGKVADLVSEIAAASGEQAQGINQIGNATGEMDKVTQQVAANAEESAAAAEELSSQAETMKGFVGDLVGLVGSQKKQIRPAKMTKERKQKKLRLLPFRKKPAKQDLDQQTKSNDF